MAFRARVGDVFFLGVWTTRDAMRGFATVSSHDVEAFQPYISMVIFTYKIMGSGQMSDFEWDPAKDRVNRTKHGIGFELAQLAFLDPLRVIAEDLDHGGGEQRYFCFGRVEGAVMTVRFTWRNQRIRIFGAGYWRKGKAIYEKANG
jgi:uncharacterized DUF497 family protein